MGFVGCAVATTLIGEVRDAPDVGFETVKGKSVEGDGGGTCACGAGSGDDCGVHVMGTGGAAGYVGCVGGGVVVFELVPQPARIAVMKIRKRNEARDSLPGIRNEGRSMEPPQK